MQLLMSEAAKARIAPALAELRDLDVLTLGLDGLVSREGRAVPEAEVDPDLFWMSVDMYPAGQLPALFRLMLKGTRGRWVQIFAAGIDNPAFRMVMAKGIRLTKSNAQAPAIAEYVIAHALSLLHPVEAFRAAQAAHEWRTVPYREIASTRWLMLGFGSIGTEIARRLQPFGAHLTIVRRNVAPEPLAASVRPTSELLDLLPESDVVVLACALNEETRGIAGRAFFEAMKPGSLFINIGRGGLVDEAALRAGLDRGQPAHAVLDVFETEPLPTNAWFWDHPKVRVTAHCAGAGDGVMARGDQLFLENLRRFRSGDALLNEAHPSEVGL